MSTIYMDLQSKSPKIERYDYDNIIVKFSINEGVREHDTTKYFDQNWMPFAWAAILGFSEGKPIPLEGDLKKDTFDYQVINNNSERIFQSLVLFTVAKKGYKILLDPQEVNKTIEEYANGGFEIIYEKLGEDKNYFNHPNDYIEFILNIIDGKKQSKKTKKSE